MTAATERVTERMQILRYTPPVTYTAEEVDEHCRKAVEAMRAGCLYHWQQPGPGSICLGTDNLELLHRAHPALYHDCCAEKPQVEHFGYAKLWGVEFRVEDKPIIPMAIHERLRVIRGHAVQLEFVVDEWDGEPLDPRVKLEVTL